MPIDRKEGLVAHLSISLKTSVLILFHNLSYSLIAQYEKILLFTNTFFKFNLINLLYNKINLNFLLKTFLFLLLLLLIIGCSSPEKSVTPKKKPLYSVEKITRKSDAHLVNLFPPVHKQREPYPWEHGQIGSLPKITKEYFRCKGSHLNPPITDRISSQEEIVKDCGGSTKHSLPLIQGKEGVYPILLDLLNYIQKKTQKKVVVTCGHRCPIHNRFADTSKENRISKHMIGGEVDFYIQGMEESPLTIVELLMRFYKETPGYRNKPEYENFSRFLKDDTNVFIPPWFNKEIFIKFYQKNEGRDFDNRHPYSYIGIQVRYDRDAKERVFYSWEQANKGLLRY